MSSTKDKKQTAYKDTPIGKIPADWEVKRLGELGEVVTGLTYSPSQVRDTGLLVLRSSNVQDRVLVYNDNVYVDERDLKYNPVKKGDILICVRNGSRALIGKNARVDYKAEGLAFGAFMAIFRSVLNDYLFHFFDTDLYYKQIHVNLGATINSINNNDLRDFKIPLPPLSEQKRIAEVLSTWDQAIQLTEQLIRQKEQRKKWLMQKLLTGKIRLKGFSGEWKEYRLKSICKISKGEQLNKIDLEKTGIYPSYSGGITPSGYTDKWNTNENTIIISEGGNSCGYVNYVTSKFWCGGHCYALLNLKEIINRDFLFQALKHQEHKIMKLRVGSGLPNVQKKDLENYPIVIPSIEEQTAIAEVLQAADKEIELLKAKAEKLKEQKKGLMQMLLTGKKRFKI